MVPNINVKDLSSYNNINLIDIRSNQNYNNNHIDGAINIPYEKLLIEPNKYLDINQKYFIYCQKGITSRKLCQILQSKGYKVVNINGGYEEWILQK